MSRSWPVMKREFMEMARSKAYILGTVLGPILILSFFALPILFIRAGAGGERMVLILDATGTGVGQEVAAGLNATALVDADRSMGAQFTAELVEVEGAAGPEREAARERVLSGEDLDGYLFLPSDFLIDGRALYEGRNATSMLQMQQIEGAATRAVRSHRLEEAGVDPAVMAAVLEPVSMDLRKPGSEDEEGGAETAFLLGTVMAMAVYFAVIMFAASVMRGVLEEKRNSIVEVLLSSVPAGSFIRGKVLGIGAASLFQMLVWVSFAAAAISLAPQVAERFGWPLPPIPEIPATVALVFLFFFTTGFLLYAAMFGAAGAIATTDQEANQLQFPVTLPLIVGIFMMYTLMGDADGAVAVAGSIIPFTAPVVMPMRSMMTDVPAAEFVAAMGLMLVALWAVMWAAAKIYRIGVLSTGKKPSLRELARWLRTA